MRIFCEAETPDREISAAEVAAEIDRARANLSVVRAVVAIASAKGGVGKSAITANVAIALALKGRKVGILDADLNAPAIFSMLGVEASRQMPDAESLDAVSGPLGLRISSASMIDEGDAPTFTFLDEPGAVSPNGAKPIEMNYGQMLRRLLGQTRFGALDLLLVDLAPGLSHLHRLAAIVDLASVVLVSQPSELASLSSLKMLKAAAGAGVPILGIVENMAGFHCDSCHSVRPMLPVGALASVAREREVPVIARLAFDPRLAESSDKGVPFVRQYADAALAKKIVELADKIDERTAHTRAAATAAI